MLAYAYVSFSFFSERIYCEEFMLLKFFGKEYREYQVTGTRYLPKCKVTWSNNGAFRRKLGPVFLAFWATRAWSGLRGRLLKATKRTVNFPKSGLCLP